MQRVIWTLSRSRDLIGIVSEGKVVFSRCASPLLICRAQWTFFRIPHPESLFRKLRSQPNQPHRNMLKVPEHQVAGHQAVEGHLGPLVDDSGRFYKPLQSGKRGFQEVEFYESLNSDARIPDHIRRYFPIFYGTQEVNASDGSGLHPHLVLQDLTSCYKRPSVVDIKIGSRTWYPQASNDYIQKCMQKDLETSSLLLGFRISGLKAFVSEDSGFWKPERKLLQNLPADDVKLVFKKFVSSNAPTNDGVQPDCLFASEVYGGSSGILAQLLELKAWFEVQTIFHFYSCSVLIMFEKESLLNRKSSGAAVKLVDFAHVIEGAGVIDHNFLGGLCSLIKFISDSVASPVEKCISIGNDTKSEKYLDGSLSSVIMPLSLDSKED